jgi:hypothetical protein
LGLAFGVAWSPRAQDGGGAQSSRGGGGHNAMGDAGGLPSSTEASRKLREDRAVRKRRKGTGVGELTKEALMQSFMGVVNEEEANLMELARYCGMITTMGESEAHDLLRALALPLEGDEENADEIRGIISAIVFTRLCELNGPEAMGMVAAGELGEEFEDDFTSLGMNSWIAADPDGAREWFYGLLAEGDELALSGGEEEAEGRLLLLEDGDDLVGATVRGLAKDDLADLTERVGQLEDPEVRADMETAIFEASVKNETSVEGLLALLETNQGESGRSGRYEALEKLRKLDVAQAAEWVENVEVSNERDRMVSRVADSMLESDPASGAEWYMNQELMSEGPQNDRMAHIVQSWAGKDFEAAESWLETQANDAQRDESESRLARIATYQNEWDGALGWVGDISDDAMREKALRSVLKHGYDRRGEEMNADLLQAAEEAGFGEEARGFKGN